MNIEELQSVLLNIEQDREVNVILSRIVESLAKQPGIALARIWLKLEGDQCNICEVRDQCSDSAYCCHLVASMGRSIVDADLVWSRTDGSSRRFPINVRKIGKVAGTGESILVNGIQADHEWMADPEWAVAEKIDSMVAHPLICRGEILGVMGIFSRTTITQEDSQWLRLFADHAAVAISNAKAFELVEELKRKLEQENAYLRNTLQATDEFGDIIGESAALHKVIDQIDLVAPTDASVLITGESGTGKELIARAIHANSMRKDRPLVKVNCGAIPKELFESEFFGHVKGSFTGAVADRQGRFQLADGGTLFLDEVGEIPLSLQSKLLRVLQEGQFERVGEEKTSEVDVRIITATNRQLDGSPDFRQDLYFRLSVFPIHVPALRERKEDVPLLADHFVARSCQRLNIPRVQLKPGHIIQMQAYDWPGNIRELQNVVERAVISSRRSGRFALDLPGSVGNSSVSTPAIPQGRGYLTQEEMDEFERDNIRKLLETTNGKVSGKGGAAELLGVRPTTLYSRIKKMGLGD